MTKEANDKLAYEIYRSLKRMEELIEDLKNSLERYRRKVIGFLLSEDVART